MNTFNSFQEVYFSSLNELISNGKKVSSVSDTRSIGSSFGTRKKDFYEIKGYSFTLSNPLNRLIFSKERKLSLGFCFANFIWLLSGSNLVEDISIYNRQGNVFSEGGNYYEAAFGERIFGKGNLFFYLKKLIEKDRNTRRAMIPIFIPSDLVKLPLDTPCVSSIQIMIRDEKVDFFLHMRSQSVVTVFPYDIFLFSMLQEIISLLLGIKIGEFHYYCNSFHYYEHESDTLKKIISEDISNLETFCMPAMSLDNKLSVNDIVNLEKTFKDNINADIEDIFKNLSYDLSDYWVEIFNLVYLKIRLEKGLEIDRSKSKYLSFENIFL
ncbi:thymidylate synthase [Bernardetia sp. OM2101]|uniref:thymidylate synthase n=1 Tax=Bernardetia sp. OM2101 TaxID=3344876 RepID=UPI0035D0F74E